MSMLAERKTKPSWVLNPRASGWSKDQNKLGQKMLEKMGWSVGKGLGAKEQGPVEAIRIAYKGDSRGLGAGRKKEQEDWLQQQESFQSLLEGLNGTNDRSVKVKSLEEKSKTTRTKIHYHKFARGKDISRYSEKDLSCIVGSGFVPIKLPETEPVLTPEANGDVATNSDGSACLELSEDNFSTGEEIMYRERSRTGRELKPTAKFAALLEERAPSPTKKKNTKQKKVEIEVVSQSKSESSKRLNPKHQSGNHFREGREFKPTASQLSASLEKMPSSPKKNKTKEICTEATPQSELGSSSAIESSDDHKDREHSRSGRAYKPTAKVATNLKESSPSPKRKKTKVNLTGLIPSAEEESSPSPKKKKIKDKPLKLNSGESGPESTIRPGEDSVHSRSRREYKPSAKALASLSERSSSPNKKKNKNPTKIVKDVNTESGSVVSPSGDHSHSRSGREYKPSAKVVASTEERSPEPSNTSKTKISNDIKSAVTDAKKKRERVHSEGSSSQTQTKKQRPQEDSTGEESGSISRHRSPKKKSKNVTTDVRGVLMNYGFTKSSRKSLPPSESLNATTEGMEQIKSKKSKKAEVGEEQHVDSSHENWCPSTTPGSTTKMNVSGPSKQSKKNRKEKNVAADAADHAAASKKIIERNHPELDHSAGEDHSLRKRLKGKKNDVENANGDAVTSEESSKPRKNKKKKNSGAGKSAMNDYPSSSSAVAPSSSKSGRLKPNENHVVENGVADAEQEAAELPEKGPKRKKKNQTAVGSAESVEDTADEQEPSTKGLKKAKKNKCKKLDLELPRAGENNVEGDNEATESPSKPKKRKKTNQNASVEEPEGTQEEPKGTKAKKKKDKPAAVVRRLESSESQDTEASKKQDSEDAMEELSSINSQSSLIFEMIGSAPDTMKASSQPEDLKKYHILVSDGEGDE